MDKFNLLEEKRSVLVVCLCLLFQVLMITRWSSSQANNQLVWFDNSRPKRDKEGREMKLEEEEVVGCIVGVFVSLLTPFPCFNALYIEDNVLSKYGVGFRGLHYHLYISVSCLVIALFLSISEKFEKSKNMHVSFSIWVFVSYFFGCHSPYVLNLTCNQRCHGNRWTQRCILDHFRDMTTNLHSTWTSYWIA